MTAAQRLRLRKLAGRLLDALLAEGDPRLLPGAGKKPSELTKEERGNRFWSIKNTRAQLGLVSDIESILGLERGALAASGSEPPALSNAEMDKAIADAERMVKEIREGATASGAKAGR